MVFSQALADASVDKKTDSVDKRPQVHESRININESKVVIDDVKSNKPFAHVEEVKEWYLDYDKDDEKDEDIADPDMAWLSGVIKLISVIVEAALWVVPFVILFYLYRYRDYWFNLIHGKDLSKKDVSMPDTLFGLDVRQESLPDNVEASAQELWQHNQCREAVSLLYRGALVALFKEYQFDLAAGATEQDCIRQIDLNNQKTSNVDSDFDHDAFIEQRFKQFKYLTEVWISIAYAHNLPNETVFNQLSNNWSQFFDNDEAYN